MERIIIRWYWVSKIPKLKNALPLPSYKKEIMNGDAKLSVQDKCSRGILGENAYKVYSFRYMIDRSPFLASHSNKLRLKSRKAKKNRGVWSIINISWVQLICRYVKVREVGEIWKFSWRVRQPWKEGSAIVTTMFLQLLFLALCNWFLVYVLYVLKQHFTVHCSRFGKTLVDYGYWLHRSTPMWHLRLTNHITCKQNF